MGALVVHSEAIVSGDLFPTSSQELCNAGLALGNSVNTAQPRRRRRDVSLLASNFQAATLPSRFLSRRDTLAMLDML